MADKDQPNIPDDGAVTDSDRSFRDLLKISSFRNLWLAQALSQTAHNGIHFVELMLIDRLTDSSGHVGLMVLAFSLPAVLFSATAGVVVDRFPKTRILFLSNLIRVFTALSYIVALYTLSGRLLLGWVYGVTFFASAIGQFFAPAEASTIPLLVGRNRLLTANSLFNLTMTGSQILGLVIIFPLAVKLGEVLLGPGGGFDLSFGLVALMYAGASWLVRFLPADLPEPLVVGHQSPLQKALGDLREGLSFIRRAVRLWPPMINLSMTATLVMIMVTLAPGYAARILHVSREDAVYIFSPIGAGMVLGTFLIGRYGHRLRREVISNAGVFWQSMILALMGLTAWFIVGSVRLTLITSFITFGLGLGFAAIGIPAQTLLQEHTPARLRGRVFSVQFLLANVLSIPPMLFAGTLADRIGIPPVILLTACSTFLLGVLSMWATHRANRSDLALDAAPPVQPEPSPEAPQADLDLALDHASNGTPDPSFRHSTPTVVHAPVKPAKQRK